MTIFRGGVEYDQVFRGSEPLAHIYRGNDLVWTRAAVRDDFNRDGWLTNWINELWLGDLGYLFSDMFGRLVDGLGNFVGSTVSFVTDAISVAANGVGKLIAQAT